MEFNVSVTPEWEKPGQVISRSVQEPRWYLHVVASNESFRFEHIIDEPYYLSYDLWEMIVDGYQIIQGASKGFTVKEENFVFFTYKNRRMMSLFTIPLSVISDKFRTAIEKARDLDMHFWKRPLTCRQNFFKQKRPEVKKEQPSLTNAGLEIVLERMWKKLPNKEKRKYSTIKPVYATDTSGSDVSDSD